MLAFWAGNEWLSIPATFSTQSNGSIDVAAQVTHFTVFAIVDDPLKGMKPASASSTTPPATAPTSASWSGNLATSGFSLLVWRGSASTAVEAAITPLQPRPVAVWALVPRTTRFLTYVPGAPSVVNDLTSLAAGQVVIIRTGSTTSVPPSTSTPSTPPPTSTAPSSARTYTVTSTDTLSDIGERFGVPFEQIAAANNIAPPYIVRAGQVLTIPGSSTATPTPSTPVTTRYVVVAGDTLTDLAARFGVSIERIAAANNIASSSGVQIGQVLTIPAAGATSTTLSPSATRTYVVVAGDTLTDIAARFGVSIERVAAANNISTASGVQIGQVLTIPAS